MGHRPGREVASGLLELQEIVASRSIPCGPIDADERIATDGTELNETVRAIIHSEASKIAGRSLYIDTEDLCQCGWIGALQAARRYDPNVSDSFTRFARARIRGSMLDEVRRVQASISAEPYDQEPQVADGPDWGRIESDCDVARAIAGLAPEEQRLLLLMYASGHRLDEIAREDGKSRSELRTIHWNALRTLRKSLDLAE